MKNTFKKLSALLIAATVSAACISLAACSGNEDEPAPAEKPAIVWDYKTWEYKDGENKDAVLEYAIYVPDSYDGTTALPLIGYVPHSSYAGKAITSFVRAECPKTWITEENMAENPAIFVIVGISEEGNDASIEGSDASQIIPILDYVRTQYKVDDNRVYWTGQSMGGIIGWSLNAEYEDYFTATVYVGCQPGGRAEMTNELYAKLIENAAFVGQTFVYIASRLDVQAHVGQDDVYRVLTENGVAEEEIGLNYELDNTKPDETNSAVAEVLAKGYQYNFFGFTKIDPASTAEVPTMMEHLNSFQYCYDIDAIFDWLLNQSK